MVKDKDKFKGWEEKLPEYWLCKKEDSKDWKTVITYIQTIDYWHGGSFNYYGVICNQMLGTNLPAIYSEATILTVKQFMEMVNEETFEKGEMVEVSGNNQDWFKYIYITTIEDTISPYICVAGFHRTQYHAGEKYAISAWKYIRKIPPKMEIEVTLNGEKVHPSTISKETWENLRK